MKRPALFVSSTCYDLKQVRSDIRQFLEDLGLEPLLSEFDSFPINPDLGTVDNCLKVVESKADIFVLVVGTRYGSTTEHRESITNLEFLTARAAGIPVYAFVMRSVLDILPVWKKNPSADFSSVADSPKLFEFVSSLKGKSDIWVFPFDTAQDIFQVLRTQLAYLFMDALNLRLRVSKRGGLTDKFPQLRGSALRLVIERPHGWEYLLFGEVLEDGLLRLSNVRKDWEYGIAMGSGPRLTPSQLFEWIESKTSEALRIAANINHIFDKALPVGFGPPGVSGDAEAIVYAAQRLVDSYRNVLEWKLDSLRVAGPDPTKRLRSIVASMCDNIVAEIEEFSRTVKATIAEALAAPRTGQRRELTITLTLTTPDLTEYERELSRVSALVESGKLDWD